MKNLILLIVFFGGLTLTCAQTVEELKSEQAKKKATVLESKVANLEKKIKMLSESKK